MIYKVVANFPALMLLAVLGIRIFVRLVVESREFSLLERIATAREDADATAAARRAALEACVKKLPESHRSLIQSRYTSEISLKDLAAATATTAAALTMRLQRIRHALLRCVEQALAGGGGT